MRTRTRGFTLLELMTTVTVVGLLCLMAYPVVTSFTGGSTLDATGRLMGAFHRAIDDSARRNRAVVCRFQDMNSSGPSGLIQLYALDAPHCRNLTNYATNEHRIAEYPFGTTAVPDDFSGQLLSREGLKQWCLNSANCTSNDLALCVTPSGAVNLIQGSTASPLAGRLQIHVQHFANNSPSGPARVIELTYGGGARLVVE